MRRKTPILPPTAVLILSTASAVILPPGSPQRTAHCLVCGAVIGATPVAPFAAVPCAATPCSCGRADTVTFWACGTHTLDDTDEVADLMRARVLAAHAQGGDHQCG